MDFSTRGNQQSPAAPRPGNTFSDDSSRKSGSKLSRGLQGKWAKLGGVVLLVAVALLLLAVIATTITSAGKSEASLIEDDKLQAVFLTNDQVYFGDITELNGKYLALSNIYYLQTQNTGTNQSATANNVSLVKLGCELHKPYDRMVINRSQVQFWENLQADGQVANAVKQYREQNPNGQKCSTGTNNSTTNVQGSQSTTPATTEDNGNSN